MYLLSLYSVKVQGQALGHSWVEDTIVTHCPYSGSLGTLTFCQGILATSSCFAFSLLETFLWLTGHGGKLKSPQKKLSTNKDWEWVGK